MKRKRVCILILIISLIFFNLVYFCDAVIEYKTDQSVYNSITKIPFNKAGLVPGTAKKLSGGNVNLYFKYRIDAAVRLFRAKKIKYVIVSGDNRFRYYNEPEDMKRSLMQQGIPENRIILDYAGLRTLDSVIRCKEIFGQNSFTIISQEFQNRRAIFIGMKKNISIIGFNARDVSIYAGFRTRIREYLARVKVFIDLYILNKGPKFLGKKIPVE